jgi:hypothetical protein
VNDRLLLLWYRFRWLLIVGAVVLAAVAGGAARRVERVTSAPATVPSSPTDLTVYNGETTVLREGVSTLAACLRDHPGAGSPGRLTCLNAVSPSLPLLTSPGVDGSLLLALGEWVDGKGATSLDVVGVDKKILSQAFAGTVVDLDNDTFDDIILFVPSSDAEFRARVLVLSRGSDGRLIDTAKERGLQEMGRYEGVLATDWNNDGFADLVLFDSTMDGVPVQLLTNGGRAKPGTLSYGGVGQEQVKQLVDGVAKTVAPSTRQRTISSQEQRRALAAAARDIDGDGFVDLIVVTRGGGGGVFWGSGKDGFVKTPLVLTMPRGVEDLVVVDVNHDDVLDIVIAYDETRASTIASVGGQAASGADSGVNVYLGSRQWDFTLSDTLSVTGVAGARALAVADLDNDGWGEIVIGVENTDSTADTLDADSVRIYQARLSARSVLEGFTLDTRPFDTPQQAVSRILAADLDADGDIDLVFSGRGSTTLRWWRNGSNPAAYLQVVVRGAGRLDSPGSSYTGIGAIVEIIAAQGISKTEIGASDGRSSSGSYLVHVGLGSSATTVNVKVNFPSSGQSVFIANVAVNQTLVVREPAP